MSKFDLGIAADEVGVGTIFRLDFFKNIKTEVLSACVVAKVSEEIEDHTVADMLMKHIDDSTVFAFDHRSTAVYGKHKNNPVYVEFFNSADRYGDEDGEKVKTFTIYIYGDRDACKLIKDDLTEALGNLNLALVKWWYRGDNGATSERTIYLPKNRTELRPEFYPDLDDPKAYLAQYLKSDASVLLLAGPPGTGKTTLLRHLICDHNLGAHVVYDEALMSEDKIFQNFLFGSGDLMVIEDADLLLTSREKDGNKLMARFLNVSDGLIKLPSKKLVFTTNITDFGRIDEALQRPGRCFGKIHTRTLNLSEAQAAAKAANLPIPTEKKEYTLADLFNQGTKIHTRQVGFR